MLLHDTLDLRLKLYYYLYNIRRDAVMPHAINYTDARQNFAKTMDRVCEDHEPVIITRRGAGAVVMLSLDDFNSLQETGYLLQSPANAARLRESLQQLAEGKAVHRPLQEA
jgi:antitoxin YefM